MKIQEILIKGLWGKTNIDLKLDNNKLILVGENGSGKTTILRIAYEVLSCNWASLSVEDFKEIHIVFKQHEIIKIKKSELKNAKNLLISKNSEILEKLPRPLKSELIERSNISGQEITYDNIIEILEEYGFFDDEINKLVLKSKKDNTTYLLNKYTKQITDNLNCKLLYLPTYRRIEKNLQYKDEINYENNRFYWRYRNRNIEDFPFKNIVAKTAMDDVEFYLSRWMNKIRDVSNLSSSKLNFQCFKDILNKNVNKIKYDNSILQKEEIKKVFEKTSDKILTNSESREIQKLLFSFSSDKEPKKNTYEQIIYYYYSMLHERYYKIKKEEEIIHEFEIACNKYLVNKTFEYNEKEINYCFKINDCNEDRRIDLEELSSGEKQIVSIFSYMYLSPFNNIFILIDEPELSLSIDWQVNILEDISNGKNCVGLLAVTHSPFVFDNSLRKYTRSVNEFIR